MGLLSRLFGRDRGQGSPYGPGYTDPYAQQGYGHARQTPGPPAGRPGQSEDERAIERYRYLLRTAPPDQVEAAHAEAFGKLTADQRRQVLEQLSAGVPASERPGDDHPQTLARAATRAEFRQPGFLERTFSGGGYGQGGYGRGGYGGGFGGGGMGMGSMIGGSLLGTVAGVVVGSAVADALFDTGLGDGGLFGGGDEEAYAEGYQDGEQADGGGDGGGDGGDAGGADYDAGGYDSGGGFDDGGGFDGGGDFGGEF
jgi:hypothetical protein